MKAQLFEEIRSTYCRFVINFCQVAIQGNPTSLAYQNYHFNYFKSMTNTLNDMLLDVNYAQINTFENTINYNISMSIVTDRFGDIIRSINFDQIDNSFAREQINQVIQKQIREITIEQEYSNSYIPVICDCLTSDSKLCAIYGTLYYDRIAKEYIFNLSYLNVEKTEQKQDTTKVSTAVFASIFQLLKKEKNVTLAKVLGVLQVYNITFEDFEDSFYTYYGSTIKDFIAKEKALESLEMVLFSSKNMEEIAENCGYKSTVALYRIYHKSKKLKANAIIRYASTNPVFA